ncbi:hypothetical protein C8J56DRAFT_895845 [Mycena floridula]|nr:hypothetical protein C8J56DRAFT_895845 [Mycena floridula]
MPGRAETIPFLMRRVSDANAYGAFEQENENFGWDGNHAACFRIPRRSQLECCKDYQDSATPHEGRTWTVGLHESVDWLPISTMRQRANKQIVVAQVVTVTCHFSDGLVQEKGSSEEGDNFAVAVDGKNLWAVKRMKNKYLHEGLFAAAQSYLWVHLFHHSTRWLTTSRKLQLPCSIPAGESLYELVQWLFIGQFGALDSPIENGHLANVRQASAYSAMPLTGSSALEKEET